MKRENRTAWVLRPEPTNDKVPFIQGALYQYDNEFYIASSADYGCVLVCLNDGIQYYDPLSKEKIEEKMTEYGFVLLSEKIKIESV